MAATILMMLDKKINEVPTQNSRFLLQIGSLCFAEQLHFVLDCPLQTFLSLCVSYAREIPCML